MRRFDDVPPESMIDSWINTASRTGAEVARAFADDGYLKVYNVDRDGQTWWEATIKGSALAEASFRRPISRATAERHLAGVIDRARTFNADGSHLIDITVLVAFGSYLDTDVQRLGDLDLGVTFRSRIPRGASTKPRYAVLRHPSRPAQPAVQRGREGSALSSGCRGSKPGS